MADPLDAPLPRPTRDDALRLLGDWCPDRADADDLLVLGDQLEEQGNDAGAALLRHVAGRIEYGLETYKGAAELFYFHNTVLRRKLGDLEARPTVDDAPTRDAGPLDRELRFYRSHLDDLLGPGDANEGRYVVIKGTDIAGVCDTFEEALRVGYGRYGLGPFLLRKIERVETVHRFSRDI
jgi:hypothetical protein